MISELVHAVLEVGMGNFYLKIMVIDAVMEKKKLRTDVGRWQLHEVLNGSRQ